MLYMIFGCGVCLKAFHGDLFFTLGACSICFFINAVKRSGDCQKARFKTVFHAKARFILFYLIFLFFASSAYARC